MRRSSLSAREKPVSIILCILRRHVGPSSQTASSGLPARFRGGRTRMSVTLAAEDLCLTQSAVSRQIHALEEVLRVKLLTRGYRSIGLTPEGETLFRAADAALQQVQDVCGALTSSVDRRPVTITTSIGVAGLWLLPRLGRFQTHHPHVDVRVAATTQGTGSPHGDGGPRHPLLHEGRCSASFVAAIWRAADPRCSPLAEPATGPSKGRDRHECPARL